MGTRQGLVLCLLINVTTFALADETPEPDADKQWEQAKARFMGEVEKLKQAVVEHLDAQEQKARERGDTARLKQVVEEREVFESRGDLPKYFDKMTYARKLKAAQDELRKAAKGVVAAYLKARRDVEAAELEAEVSELVPSPEKSSAQPALIRRPVRWLNTSYDSTIYHVQGKEWVEKDNKSGKIHWHLNETGRSGQSIEFFNRERKDVWRLSARTLEVKEGSQWKVIAHGHWDESPQASVRP